MNVRRVVAIVVLAILALVMPSSASASITPTPETRIGVFELREPALIGFAVTRTVETHRAKSIRCADLASQHSLRWKGMWRFDVGTAGNPVELYDARARMWSPALGTFLSVDQFAFHDPTSTLWAWPNQNPVTFSDPSGRDGTTNNPIQDLVDSGFLPPGLTIFGKGARMRASGISMMANDATVEQGMAKAACGSAIMAAGAGVVGTDTAVLVGTAELSANLAKAVGAYRSVGGHHIHAKAAFRGNPAYNARAALAISQKAMKDLGINHQVVTAAQQRLFGQLAANVASGAAENSLAAHTAIAEAALLEGGATAEQASALAAESVASLAEQGVTAPTRIPWYGP